MTACSGGSTASYAIVPGASSHNVATQNPRRPRIRPGSYAVIHAFSGGQDGASPHAGLTIDGRGNLYGTTEDGGLGYGTAFKMTPVGSGWIVSSLHEFTNNSDGAYPFSRVVAGTDGNLYGTNEDGGQYGGGVVYKLTIPVRVCTGASCPWTLTVLHPFNLGADGHSPLGDITFDAAGNMYGTASSGGAYQMGTVWELSRQGIFSVLYAFGTTGMQDGALPEAGVVLGSDGALYGTTDIGGAYGAGSVFKLTQSGSGWTETRLHDFQDGSDGGYPFAGLIFDASGNLYGSTLSSSSGGGGTIYKLAASQGGWTFSVLHSFSAGYGGPKNATLVMDPGGDLYGTTYGDGLNYLGSVFEVTPQGQYTDLYDFSNGDAGNYPLSTITFGTAGGESALFGTTSEGGSGGAGVVFEISSLSDRNRRSRHH
jgi:uncharacterized repeat protein (TIGR03803 family)